MQPPLLHGIYGEEVLKPYEIIRDQCEELVAEGLIAPNDPHFWQMRLIASMATSSDIISMSIFPKALNEPVPLFFQKKITNEETIGFVAPYLSEEEGEKWGAVTCENTRITDEESLLESISDLSEGVRQDVYECLIWFLNDSRTAGLALTYQEQEGTYTTQCWTKNLSQ